MKSILLALVLFATTAVAHAQVNILYDDDCTSDNDCGVNFATLHKLADRGEINILATIANSANPLAAPAMKIFNTYYGRPTLPVGANQTPNPDNPLCAKSHCNAASWLPGLVTAFDPDPKDTRAHYPDCVTVYRQALTGQPDHSVTVVSTGFLTCIAQMLGTPADATLLKTKTAKLVIMGGAYPQGHEFNLAVDPTDSATVFTAWTTQNGFPPIWLISFADGAKAQSGPPANDPKNPISVAFKLANSTQRGSWDSMSILFAARGVAYKGQTYWTESGDGTVTIDLTTGENSFSTTTHSGQHFLINALSDDDFSKIFDGYQYKGFASEPPTKVPPATH